VRRSRHLGGAQPLTPHCPAQLSRSKSPCVYSRNFLLRTGCSYFSQAKEVRTMFCEESPGLLESIIEKEATKSRASSRPGSRLRRRPAWLGMNRLRSEDSRWSPGQSSELLLRRRQAVPQELDKHASDGEGNSSTSPLSREESIIDRSVSDKMQAPPTIYFLGKKYQQVSRRPRLQESATLHYQRRSRSLEQRAQAEYCAKTTAADPSHDAGSDEASTAMGCSSIGSGNCVMSDFLSDNSSTTGSCSSGQRRFKNRGHPMHNRDMDNYCQERRQSSCRECSWDRGTTRPGCSPEDNRPFTQEDPHYPAGTWHSTDDTPFYPPGVWPRDKESFRKRGSSVDRGRQRGNMRPPPPPLPPHFANSWSDNGSLVMQEQRCSSRTSDAAIDAVSGNSCSSSSMRRTPRTLKHKVIGLLNKISPENEEEIKSQLLALPVESFQDLETISILITEKALWDPFYSEVYVRCIDKLCLEYAVVPFQEEKNDGEGGRSSFGFQSFKMMVLGTCNRIFESLFAGTNDFSDDDIQEPADWMDDSNSEAALERRGCAQAFMRLLGHLFVHGIYPEILLQEILSSLLEPRRTLEKRETFPAQDWIECVCELLYTVNKEFTKTPERQALLRYTINRLDRLKDMRQGITTGDSQQAFVYPKRMFFMIQDIIEASRRGWPDRSHVSGAKSVMPKHTAKKITFCSPSESGHWC